MSMKYSFEKGSRCVHLNHISRWPNYGKTI